MRTDHRLDLGSHDTLGDDFPFEQHPGVSHSGNERNHLFMNRGDGDFLDVSPVSGLDDIADGRAWAKWDFDHDGWTDIALVNANSPQLRLFRNRIGESEQAAARRWVAVRLVGGNDTPQPNAQRSPRDGYGAKIRLDLGETELLREHLAAEGFAAQSSATQLIGVGSLETVPSLSVTWPSGTRHSLQDVPTGKWVVAYEDPSQSPNGEPFELRNYPRAGNGAVASAGTRRNDTRPLALPASASGTSHLTVVTTMATWCPKCKGELPQLAELRARFSPQEIALRALPIDPEDTPEKLGSYRSEFQPAYELIEGLSRTQIERLHARIGEESGLEDPLPASLVLDADGRVVSASAGVPTVSQLRKLLVQNPPGGQR